MKPLRAVVVPFALAVVAGTVMAQEGDGLPTEHVQIVPPGAFIDLDTGLLLPSRTFRKDKADLHFGRDGAGFFLEPLAGGARTRSDAVSPPDELSTERVRIARHDDGALVLFARTDRGMARVELMVADPYATASASLRWVVVPPKSPLFLPAPTDLQSTWKGDTLEVTWQGDEPRWLVEVTTAGATTKVLVEAKRASIPGLAPTARHHIVVRGVAAEGTVTMPADVVQHGPRQVPVRGVAEYSDRWYDDVGGLKLSTGAPVTIDAEVVFYLYGVTVPGGGVRKMGEGERVFAALHELPGGAYPPTYGRLDDHDVLAIRTADGRFGKVWLEPAKGADVRSGMRVHFVFLPDGRRRLLAPPRELTWGSIADGIRLAWQGEQGLRHRVQIGDKIVFEGADTACVLKGLASCAVFECGVQAIGADGELSSAARTVLHTHGPAARFAQATIGSDNGITFATGELTKMSDGPDLAIVNSAGGASYLGFQAKAGMAGAGEVTFGDFAAAAKLGYGEHFASDNREANADRFFVRTPDGGMASVRIVRREHPDNVIEYLWVPKR